MLEEQPPKTARFGMFRPWRAPSSARDPSPLWRVAPTTMAVVDATPSSTFLGVAWNVASAAWRAAIVTGEQEHAIGRCGQGRHSDERADGAPRV